MFTTENVFVHNNLQKGRLEWFFSVPEGTFGPYRSKAHATELFNEFTQRGAQPAGASGYLNGRGGLALEMPDDGIVYDPWKTKKGKDNARASHW